MLSLNLHRRHLTTSQLAMVGARARDLYDRQAKERQRESGKVHGRGKEKVPAPGPEPIRGDSRDQAGAAVGVGGKTVDAATKGSPAPAPAWMPFLVRTRPVGASWPQGEARGLAKEVGLQRRAEDVLLFRERRQYFRAIQDALAGAEAARVVLAGVVNRMEDR